MDQEALRRAKLLLIVKFLHELQHRATRLYFTHVAGTPASEQAAKVHLSGKLNSPTSMGTRSRSALKTELRHTPERIGSVKVGGIARGDSGYALEELLLGGRLRHRHLHRGAHFDVSAQARLRMHLLSLNFSEFPCADSKSYSHDGRNRSKIGQGALVYGCICHKAAPTARKRYVHAITVLNLNASRVSQGLMMLPLAGNWSDMHYSRSDKADTTGVVRSKVPFNDSCSVKLAQFMLRGHEGEAGPGDPDDPDVGYALFVPGACLRDDRD